MALGGSLMEMDIRPNAPGARRAKIRLGQKKPANATLNLHTVTA